MPKRSEAIAGARATGASCPFVAAFFSFFFFSILRDRENKE